MEGAQERVLRHILGLVVPYYTRGNAHDDIVVPYHQLLEGVQVSPPRPLDEELI